MKALSSSRDSHDPGAHGWASPRRSILVLASLLLLLFLPFATGCSIVEDLTVSAPPETLGTGGPATVEPETTSTVVAVAAASPTTSVAEATTTTATEPPTTTTATESTSTTLPELTTTTIAEATSTTIAEATSTTIAGDTTTTAPEGMPASETPTTTATTVAAAEETQNVLYEIDDWSEGTSGWAAAGQWKTAGGMLVTDGSSDSFAVAPVDLTDYPDYAIECEIQLLNPNSDTDVYLLARMINGSGYWAGFDSNNTRMIIGYGSYGKRGFARVDFVLDGGWHKYRLEVRGNTLKLFFEGAEVARAMDNRALEPGTVGIYCGNGQIDVRSFRVIAL
jgi:hypothetical protein